MSNIPDAWPPPEIASGPQTAPLFPLANVWLFPRTVMPLQIFEPRYKQMVEDSLDGPGRIVMGTVRAGHEQAMAGSPPVHPVAGLGEIVGHQRLPDGRFLISLFGLARVRVAEVESERLYRRVAIEPLIEPSLATGETEKLRKRLRSALKQRSEERRELPDEAPVDMLTDMLVMLLDLSHDTLQGLFAEPDPRARAQRALLEHERAG